MKVTIVNCFPDSNKGSCAIVWGLIRRLQSTGLFELVTLVSMCHESYSLYEHSHRHIQRAFPKVSVVGAPLPDHLHALNPINRLIGFIKRTVKLSLLTRNKAKSDKSLREIATANLVLDRGGPFFAASGRVLNLSLHAYAFPLLIAKKFYIPYGFAPGTFGPFVSSWSRQLMYKLCKDAQFIMIRDPFSKDELATCGVDPTRVFMSLDSAFWVEGRMSSRVTHFLKGNRIEPNTFLAVTTRAWYRDLQQQYHRRLAEVIDTLVPSTFPRAVLVANMVEPSGYILDDRPATWELYRMLRKKEYVVVMEEDLAPDELVALYGQAQLVIGTRLHSVIMALATGTPAIAVSYTGHKTSGVMASVDLSQYTVKLESFDKDIALPLIFTALSSRDQIGEKVGKFKGQSDEIFRQCIDSIATTW